MVLKFTQQQAFDSIKAQLPTNRVVSDRSINDTLETLMVFATEETELADFVKSTFPVVRTTDGNLRSEIAIKAKEFEDKAKPAKTPEEIKADQDAADKAANEIPSWYKKDKEEYEKKISDLQDKLTGQEAQKTTAERQAEILASETTTIWNDNIVAIASDGFDFSKENASELFAKKLEFVGSKSGAKPAANQQAEKPASEKFSSMKADMVKSGMIQIPEEKKD
jgi:hypothetical protein